MPKKKRKKKKKSRTELPSSDISKNANPIRFLIFLAIGLILLGAFYFFLILKGGF